MKRIMDYTQVLGNTNELKCLIAFIELRYECSIPYGNGAKYDFIVDNGDKLYKIQCKSSRYVNDHGTIKTDCIIFSTINQTTNTKETIRKKYTSEEVDYFATSFNGKVYVIPIDECSNVNSKTLRFSPPKNNVEKYSKAEDYEIEKVFKKSESLENSEIEYKNKISKTKTQKSTSICSNCGKEITLYGKLCVDCSHIEARKTQWPDREKLKLSSELTLLWK